MKRYQKFMDGVKPSDTLGQRLRALKEPKKKPAWTKYGAMAAALVLVCGLGAWAARRNGLGAPVPPYPSGYQGTGAETADEPVPDIALEGPGGVMEPGKRILGSYDVTNGEMVSHYILPYIEYGAVETESVSAKIALDWALGEGYTEGPVSQEEMAALLGGEDVLSDHLDWDGYELFGWRYDRADGTPGLVMISGHQGELDHFEFALMYGELPPTCIAYPESVKQDVNGVIVTADKYDGEYGFDRRVSFMKDGWGYRFDVTATDADRAELLASRLVRRIIDEGLDGTESKKAVPVTPDGDGGAYTCTVCGQAVQSGAEHAHRHPFTGVGEPNWNDGMPSQDTCPNCGATYPVGQTHDCTMCDGYPVPRVCEVCGAAYPEGTAHSHEACGLLLAPGSHICEVCGEAVPDSTAHDCAATHTCEVCGQTLRAGMEHSHQEDRQQDHHGGHH